MPDTQRTLSALQTLFADNVNGDISAQDARDALVSFNVPCGPELSVTGATTATLGQWHVCTGTTADYTVTLPAVSGNSGRYIAFRMSPALTKLVTLDGNGSETIDGATTRVMWAGESAVLYCDGSAWFKVAGRTIAMSCMLQSGTATVANHDTVTLFDLGTSVFDVGSLGDTTNDRVVIRRAGRYNLDGMVNFGSLANDTRIVGYFYAGSSPSIWRIFQSLFVRGASGYASGSAAHGSLEAGHFVELRGSWDVAGGSSTKSSLTSNVEQRPFLAVEEVPQW